MYLGSFAKPEDGRRYYNYREFAPKVISYVKEMGYTHVELMPVMEHPLEDPGAIRSSAIMRRLHVMAHRRILCILSTSCTKQESA